MTDVKQMSKYIQVYIYISYYVYVCLCMLYAIQSIFFM